MSALYLQLCTLIEYLVFHAVYTAYLVFKILFEEEKQKKLYYVLEALCAIYRMFANPILKPLGPCN